MTRNPTRSPCIRDTVREAVELVNSGRILEAESLLIESAESPGLHAGERCQLARLALQMEKPYLARGLMEHALSAAPNSPEVRFLAGVSDRLLGHLHEAREHLVRARPQTNPDAAYYLSVVEEALGNFMEAREAVAFALEKHPEDADYLNQSACLAMRFGDFETGLTLSQKAHQIEPEEPGLAFNHAQNLLLTGRASEAWPLFDARLAFISDHLRPRNGSTLWDGCDLDGKSLLIWHEQGLGDTIQFSRYLLELVPVADHVIFRCQAECAGLLAPHLPGIQIFKPDESLPRTDFHLPLMSLPGRIGAPWESPPPSIFGSLPSRVPIRRIGFALSGNPNHPDDRSRSIPMADFAPLFQQNYEWICLQKHLRGGETLPPLVRHPASKFRDFSDTAAEVESVDLMISADTAVAHLAASLGKSTWILLPLCPDWRWGQHGESTTWYSSARLFRQSKVGDWIPVIQEIGKRLSNV